MKTYLTTFCLLWTINANSHGGSHETKAKAADTAPEVPSQQEPLKEIAASYESVRPIFENKCIMCHGGIGEKPWYYIIPGPRHLIDHDIKDATKHLDFSVGYPFRSHDTPAEDLKAIAEEVEEKEMPPLLYWIMHRNARLTDEESKAILDWTKTSISRL